MNGSPEYPFSVQSKIVPALGAIHNFIRHKDSEDHAHGIRSRPAERIIAEEILQQQLDDEHSDGDLGSDVTAAERIQANERRDLIAMAMWNDYVAYTN